MDCSTYAHTLSRTSAQGCGLAQYSRGLWHTLRTLNVTPCRVPRLVANAIVGKRHRAVRLCCSRTNRGMYVVPATGEVVQCIPVSFLPAPSVRRTLSKRASQTGSQRCTALRRARAWPGTGGARSPKAYARQERMKHAGPRSSLNHKNVAC